MRIFKFWLAALLLTWALPPSWAAEGPLLKLNLITGAENGTYFAVGRDLEKLLAQNGIDLAVIPSAGTLQNVSDVQRYRSLPLGLAQLDVLAYLNLALNDDSSARHIAEELRIVLPLYREEVHLLARAGIKQISDLNGEKIAIGELGSGTSVTALTLLELAHVEPAELLNADFPEALAALRRGEIAAAFYVVGAPAEVLTQQVRAEDRLHLLPVLIKEVPDDEFLTQLYPPAILAAEVYPWQKEAVATVTVGSALVTTTRADYAAISPVAKALLGNLAWLQQNGHAKWKSVAFDPAALATLDRLSPCVAELLKAK